MTESDTANDKYIVIEGVLTQYQITHYTIEQHQGTDDAILEIIDVEHNNLEKAREKALGAFANKIIQYSRANSVNLGPQAATLYLVEHFSGVLNNNIVVGEFSGLRLLKSGDYVKAVVEKEKAQEGITDDWYRAHAIIRERDELLWLPVTVMRGEKNARRSKKIAFSIMNVITVLVLFFMSLGIRKANWFEVFLYLAAGMTVLWWSIYFFTLPSLEKRSNMAEILFRKLGFPEPENLSFYHARYENLHDPRIKAIDIEYRSVYYYGLVLAAKQAGRGVPLTLPELPVETPDNQAEVHDAYLKIKEMLSQPKDKTVPSR